MESFWNDVRYSLRTLARDRGFASVAVLTLALGIGANTAIFSIIDGVMLRPLTYRDPARLVTIHEVIPKMAQTYPELPVNALHFAEWRQHSRSFEQLVELDPFTPNLTGLGEPEQLGGSRVSANFFHTLGVQPQLGRDFLEEEDRPGHNDVALLTDSLWKRRFGRDPSIAGKKIVLGGVPHTVVGVLPPSFHFPKGHQLDLLMTLPEKTEVFKPLGLDLAQDQDNFNYIALGRLRSGVTRERARAELNVLQAGISSKLPDKMELKAVLSPLQDQMVGQVRRGLLVLMGAVGAVLLIVCLNLANLSLVRGAARSRESAIRTALGAARSRLLRQPLTESLLLSLIGGIFGVLFAIWGLGALTRIASLALPRLEEVRLDARALGFALVLSTLTGLLFGVLPAWRMTRVAVQEVLRSGGRTATGGAAGTRLRGILVGLEVGLSAALLMIAGLLIASFVRLMQVDKGFQVERLLVAGVGVPGAKYKEAASRAGFFERVLAGMKAVPGVRSAALISALPLQGENWVDIIWLAGDNRPMFERPTANIRFISPDYFRTAGIPLRRGRAFEESDRNKDVVVISERAAERLWPGQDPVGRSFYRGDEHLYQVIGVTGDVRTSLQQGPVVTVYVPYWKQPPYEAALLVRTAVDPHSVSGAVRSEVWKVDPDVPVPQMKTKTMQEIIADDAAPRRFQMLLVFVFAATALLLASLGVFGVVSYTVTRRTNEIGVRIAMGARGADVYSLVLRQGMMPVIAGLAAGIGGALALGRVLRTLLFEVSPADPLTMGAVVFVLAVVSALACSVPAFRAMRVDPMTALRYE